MLKSYSQKKSLIALDKRHKSQGSLHQKLKKSRRLVDRRKVWTSHSPLDIYPWPIS